MIMDWLLPVFLRIGIGQIIGPFVLKKNSTEHGRIPRFLFSFITATVCVLGYALIVNNVSFDQTFLLILLIGIANGGAAYCQWRAVDLSLSRTYLFSWLDDVTSLLLAYFILHEGRFLNLWVSLGIGFSLVATVMSSWFSYHRKHAENIKRGIPKPKGSGIEIYFWILSYSIVWGVVVFLMRYLALQGVNSGTFLLGWYGGSVISASFIFLVAWLLKKEKMSFNQDDAILSSSQGIIASVSQALNYWAMSVAPLVIVQPLFLVSETVFPVLIGLFGFKEHRHLREGEWLSFAFGSLGAILVIVGFLQR
jgi:hypothetical protein